MPRPARAAARRIAKSSNTSATLSSPKQAATEIITNHKTQHRRSHYAEASGHLVRWRLRQCAAVSTIQAQAARRRGNAATSRSSTRISSTSCRREYPRHSAVFFPTRQALLAKV